ncbi:hypothetical protein XENTR_v10017175 [Xenopus tropicalis]|nr:hypothetical protein XENTR_v10017175 [Xenopus tropicalis]
MCFNVTIISLVPFRLTVVQKISIDASKSTDKMFITSLRIDGFHPDDVTVQVTQGKVHIKRSLQLKMKMKRWRRSEQAVAEYLVY